MAFHVVIMAGGSGVRFWPRSRQRRPKQLLVVTGTQSLLQQTILRVEPLQPEGTLVVTAAPQAEATAAQVAALKPVATGRVRVLVEPAARNTAPAVAFATAIVAREDPDATMVVLPADHHIERPATFRAVLQRAMAAAEGGALVTLGITPTRAETGYGWVEMGEAVTEGVHRVRRFREKPDRATAEAYLAAGHFLWNAGMFVWKVAAIREAFRRHMPELHAHVERIVSAPEAEVEEAVERLFDEAPSESIDYGVMEKHDDVLVLPASMGWSDVGSWASLAEISPKDAGGNTVTGDAVLVDVRRCSVHSSGRLVAAIGVEDLVIVETPDAVLVCPLDRAQDVRRIVDELKRRGSTELL